MNIHPEGQEADPRMDPAQLYREEIFTDRQMGTIHRLTPVKPDGSPDSARKTLYVGESQILTSAGALPLNFEIDAASLDEAAAKFGAGMKQAFTEAVEEIKEMRRKAASSLVLPQSGLAPAGHGPAAGGKKITLPY
ncbi:MAG: hypothetical protein WCU88_09965 [Elusimicrobiota bacterium]|jgi:hypothetical protein